MWFPLQGLAPTVNCWSSLTASSLAVSTASEGSPHRECVLWLVHLPSWSFCLSGSSPLHQRLSTSRPLPYFCFYSSKAFFRFRVGWLSISALLSLATQATLPPLSGFGPSLKKSEAYARRFAFPRCDVLSWSCPPVQRTMPDPYRPYGFCDSTSPLVALGLVGFRTEHRPGDCSSTRIEPLSELDPPSECYPADTSPERSRLLS